MRTESVALGAVVFSVGLLHAAPPARACSPSPPDAGMPVDAAPPGGHVFVYYRETVPAYVVTIPTNMRFVVAYELSRKNGATLDWLGDISLRASGGEILDVDVVKEVTTQSSYE